VMQSSSSDQGADGKPKSFADMMPSVRSIRMWFITRMEWDGLMIGNFRILA
jgi:hypothetical protein